MYLNFILFYQNNQNKNLQKNLQKLQTFHSELDNEILIQSNSGLQNDIFECIFQHSKFQTLHLIALSDISTHSVVNPLNECFVTSSQFSNLQYHEDELENGVNMPLYKVDGVKDINSKSSENRLVDFVPEHSSITSSDQTLYTRSD